MKVINYISLILLSTALPAVAASTAATQQKLATVAQAKRTVTPTLAFLTNPDLLKSVRTKFGKQIDQCKESLIKPVLLKEAQHATTHVPFYHAQNVKYLLLYDVLESIYTALNPGKKIDHFTFMRFWHAGVSQKTAQEFIDAHEQGNHTKTWYDGEKDLSAKILSTNYSLFGNVIGGACSFDYFLQNTNNVTYSLDELLNPVFDYYKFDKKYIDQVNKLSNALHAKSGIVCQLLIPNELVDKCVYISSPGGTPYRSTIAGVDGFDKYKNRYTKISPLLQAYRNNPALIKQSIEGLQARVVFIPEMLNPESGVKIFRYANMDVQEHKDYQAKIADLCKQMVANSKHNTIKSKL